VQHFHRTTLATFLETANQVPSKLTSTYILQTHSLRLSLVVQMWFTKRLTLHCWWQSCIRYGIAKNVSVWL